MPINLERPLINSNLDSYLGEAGTGWAGCAWNANETARPEPREQQREERWQFYFCPVGFCFPPRNEQSRHRQVFFGEQITLVI